MSLSSEDIERHKRHIMLKEIGGPGVAKLRAASVSIIGAGALGGPCALYLAAAGIGHISVWDDDHVDRSNLQRQIQFSDNDIGKPKAELLASRCLTINPALKVTAHKKRFMADDTLEVDIIIDATDNFETRFVLNRLAHQSARPLVHGAAAKWTGQAAVFMSGLKADAPCYQCWVPETPPDAETCDEVGVVGPITGLIGTRMALETMKLIIGAGSTLSGKLLLLDGLSGDSRTLKLRKDPACPVCSVG